MARLTFSTRPTSVPVALASMVAEDRTSARSKPTLKSRLLFAIGPTIMLAFGATVVASAQSNSPFANKKKVNAWELPQAGTTPQPDVQTQTRTTVASPTRPSGGLMLRSRDLSIETAAAPLPGAPLQIPTPVVPAPTAQTTQPVQATSVQSATAQPTPIQSIPSENYVYGAPSSASGMATSTPLVASPWQLSGPGPRPYNNSLAGNPPAGSYANVPRGSVNSPPSRAASDQTDWTVHELQPQARPYPGQQANAKQTGSWGQYETQTQNPTAYDYGYRRPGEPSAEPMASGSPTDSQYGTYGGPDTRTAQHSPNPQNSDPNGGQYQDPYAQPGPNGYGAPGPAPKQGFFNRLGLGGITSLIRGAIRGGVAARENNGWKEAFVGDADIALEISTVTQGGLEWGIYGQVRAQYDDGRKGFTRRLADCPPTLAGCPSILVAGTATSVRGHSSQFYTFGPDAAKDTQVALESAHLFLRSAYGDVTVGRDDGAAYLFSLGAPSLLNVGASNSSVDYTGLDAVKTLNDASGFAEKVTYTSPRLLGDQVGLGIQFGVSYALDAEACGVDYCVDYDGVPSVVTPELEDVMEAGIALDRTFAPGVSVELTGTYARGSEQSGLTGLDDLQAFGAGLEFRMRDWTVGGSYLNSNQGLMNGDYESYDVGLTWQPSVLGFTLGYGHASDDNVGLSSDQITGGVTYDINEKIRIGAGVQYSDRDTVQDVAGTALSVNEKATAIFVEAGITF